MKKIYATVAAIAVLLFVPVAFASSIKTWSTGETIRSSDLNANFSHIHTAAEALITNAKVSASAAIAHSKLATPALLPKAWAYVAFSCSSTPCTLAASSGVTSITRSGAGLYSVTWSTARSDANYAVQVTAIAAGVFCNIEPPSTTAVALDCYSHAGALTDTGLNILLMDNT